MLYDTYQVHSDVLAPIRLMAEFFRGVLTQPWPLIENAPLVRSAAAAMELLSNAGMSHDRPEFGIRKVAVDGEEVGVTEEVVASHPFCRLLHFRKEETRDEPTVLVVAPLSGHFSTLLRGTVATLLPDHNVYITDWVNARNIPLLYGRFDLDDFVDVVSRFVRLLGPKIHVMAVCQPSVPVLAAVSLLAAAGDPCQPASMILMGGPIDPRANPTEVNRFAMAHSLDWFDRTVITTVPARYPGAFRRVYPGFLQLAGFLSMNFDRHVSAHWSMFHNLVKGDGDSAAATRAFYKEYSSVMDLPADFYLQTIKRVFHDHDLPLGPFPGARRPGRAAGDRADRVDDRRGRERRHLRGRADRRRARSLHRHPAGKKDAPPPAQSRPLWRVPRPPVADRDLPQGQGVHPRAGPRDRVPHAGGPGQNLQTATLRS